MGIIKAWSPQAKGRIERLWGVLQDRLVVELRLKKAQDMQQANEVLKIFLPEYNKRFNFPSKKQESAFRKAPLSINWTVSYASRIQGLSVLTIQSRLKA